MLSAWFKRIRLFFIVLLLVATTPILALILWLWTTRTAVFLLQNHHELRATGGFLGSVVVLTGSLREPIRWKTYDIYSLSGQNTVTIQSPPGYREFLSGGKPLQLADANWWPDVPYTASIVSQMLESATIPKPDLIVFLNTQTVQALLQIIGPLTLPDFQTELTSENIFQVISSVRGDFFPGSRAKANVLQHLVTQCFYHLRQKGITQLPTLWKFAESERSRSNIFIWSPHTLLNVMSQALHTSGEMHVESNRQDSTLYLYPVESNVGVNKANAGITRQYSLKAIDDNTTDLEVTWRNSNPLNPEEQPELVRLPGATGADHTHYANYFRMYTLPHTTISQVQSDGLDLSTMHHGTFISESGVTFNEFGILVPVLAQTTVTAHFTIQHPVRDALTSVELVHQAGLTDTTYQVVWNSQTVSSTPFNTSIIWQPRVQ